METTKNSINDANFTKEKCFLWEKKNSSDSYWGILHRDTSLRRYITRNFRVRGPNFTNIDGMKDSNFTSIDNHKVGLNTAIKDKWKEASEAQGYNSADLNGRYSEENDYNTELICKLLQRQAASHISNEKFYGKNINYQYFMSMLKEIVEDRIEDPRGKLIKLIKYTCQVWSSKRAHKAMYSTTSTY